MIANSDTIQFTAFGWDVLNSTFSDFFTVFNFNFYARPDPESSCTSCTTEVFSESKLSSSTLSNMKKYWPTCQGNSNDDFWSHEWSKHGTCTGLSQDAYFSKGLSLYNSYGSKCKTDCHLCFTPSFSYTGLNTC